MKGGERILKKKILLATLAVTIAGVSLWGTTSVNAQGPQDLVTKISQKFNLKESDVKAIFDEAHKERQTNMQKHVEERLSKEVQSGKITESQKQAILTKLKELQTQREAKKESMKNMTPEQRKETRQKEKTDLEAWAKSNGIDLQTFHGILGPKGFVKAVK